MDGSRDPLFGDEFADALDPASRPRRGSVDGTVAGAAIERALTAHARENLRDDVAADLAARRSQERGDRTARPADDRLGATAEMPTVRPRTTEARRTTQARPGARPGPRRTGGRPPGEARPREARPARDGAGPVTPWPSVATGGVSPREKVPARARAAKAVRGRVGTAVRSQARRAILSGGPPPVVWWALAALAVVIVLIALLTRPMTPARVATASTTSVAANPSAPGSAPASASATASPVPTGVQVDVRVEDTSGASTQRLVVSSGTTTLVAGRTPLPYHATLQAGPGQTLSILVPQPTPGSSLRCVVTAQGAVVGSMTREAADGMLDCTTRVADIAAGGT